jgi:outer membrane protein OmpA-like peptidoglycan-associated protein
MASKPKKQAPKKQAEEGAPGWMTTYGDMVTLLLTFFVLLVSMMVVDPKKFVEVLGTFRDAGGDGQDIPQEIEPVKKEDYFVQIIRVATRRSPRPDGGEIVSSEGEAVRVYSFRENYVVPLGDAPFFREFEITLTQSAKEKLASISDTIRQANMNRIRLTGHFAQGESRERFQALATDIDAGGGESIRGLVRRTQRYSAEAGGLEDELVVLNSEEDLAVRRAKAVREYLISLGTDPNQIEVSDGGQLGPALRIDPKEAKALEESHSAFSMRTGRSGGLPGQPVIRQGSPESRGPETRVTRGLEARAWPSFHFTEGGGDLGRTVTITVTGEVVKPAESYLRPVGE